MGTRKTPIMLKCNPIEVVGNELAPGQQAPEFTLQTQDLKTEALSESKGKTRILLSVLSVDTGTCSTETKRFNDEAQKLPGVDIIVVSMDLPFGHKRFCGAENIDRVRFLSAHRDENFGQAYGVLIRGGGLDRCLARAVFVIGPDNKLRHVEYCKEVSAEPNYEAALAAARG